MFKRILKKINPLGKPLDVVKAFFPAVGAALEIGGKAGKLAADFLGKQVTGTANAKFDEIVDILQKSDGDQIKSYQKADIEFQIELIKQNINLFELHNQNTSGAREMYMQKNDMADAIAKTVMRWSLPLILGLIVVAAVGYTQGVKDPLIYALISGTITQLYNERGVLMNFFFGSSMGSKIKDDKLNDLF